MNRWGAEVNINLGDRVRWDVGTRAVWAQRHPGQWLLGIADVGDELREDLGVDVGPWSEAEDGLAEFRVAVGEGDRVRLVPRPPTRALLARPDLPLAVPAQESAIVYVGIPLWGEVIIGGRVVLDHPLVRLSDTWFGTPLEGELCFATRTHLSMDRASVGRRAFRAVCTVSIVNRSDEALPLERLRIPGPALNLWQDSHGGLCSSTVRVVREAGRELEEVFVLADPPPEAGGAALVGAAREPQTAPRLSKALSVVWKGIGGAF